mmetsp:Transcript_17332/g.37426  ORF Transcript_17332/g.37426 Transcript_17332/m.37426 type:complete len:83 (+) Transcript_17332:751-999(+)
MHLKLYPAQCFVEFSIYDAGKYISNALYPLLHFMRCMLAIEMVLPILLLLHWHCEVQPSSDPESVRDKKTFEHTSLVLSDCS